MTKVDAVVLICASAEWRPVLAHFPEAQLRSSPFAEWFQTNLPSGECAAPVVFLHTGWGKIASAASTQYAIDRWYPDLIINLGTCGGFEGEVDVGTILLIERTLVYDIVEQMSDPAAAIARYTTDLDLTWFNEPPPVPVRRSLLISADRDLVAEEVPVLAAQYGAIAGDWESAAIAFIASRNSTRCLILRGVSDLVGTHGGEAYADPSLWTDRAGTAMRQLLRSLPAWLDMARR